MTDRSAEPLGNGVELTLYCHGLGDCHLISLPASTSNDLSKPEEESAPPGDKRVWMMIDCGLHGSTKGGTQIMTQLYAAIHEELKDQPSPKLAVVVLTHEHQDHNSGFNPSRGLFKDAKPDVGEVWLGWTENPADPLGSQLDKYKSQAFGVLAASRERIDELPGLAPVRNAWEAMIGFYREDMAAADNADAGFALKGEITRTARDAAAKLSDPKPPRYLEPGDVIEVPGVDAVRCYVLAPPRNTKLLGLLDSATETFSAGSASQPGLNALANAIAVNEGTLSLDEDEASPFDGSEGMPLGKALDEVAFLKENYSNDPKRKIDHDWLLSASDLALQLDAKTNNSSLVLAIEIVASGHVLLFAADAQVGNWKSWADVRFPAVAGRPATTGADLMARTVFYKVGHHGSRNATLKEGLERMCALEVAFNPTDRKMAQKVGWNDIPAERLNAELSRRTKGRLIESDLPWVIDRSRAIPISAGGALRAIGRGEGPSLKLVFD